MLVSGEKKIAAFWAKAFIVVDGAPHVVTPEDWVVLDDPPIHKTLPSLHVGHPPDPLPHPWDREN